MVNRTKLKVLPGFVYALTNEAMPGLVKIGRTVDLRKRLVTINGYLTRPSGFPDFEMPFYAQTKDCKRSEKIMHMHLHSARIGRSELFRLTLPDVRDALTELVGPVTDYVHWPFPRPSPNTFVRHSWRAGPYYPGGYQTYMWLRKHHDEIACRLAGGSVTWPQLAYEIGVAIARPEERFRPLPPDVIQQLWSRAKIAVERGYE